MAIRYSPAACRRSSRVTQQRGMTRGAQPPCLLGGRVLVRVAFEHQSTAATLPRADRCHSRAPSCARARAATGGPVPALNQILRPQQNTSKLFR